MAYKVEIPILFELFLHIWLHEIMSSLKINHALGIKNNNF